MLDQATSVFTELKCQRPNKSPIVSYILVQLKSKMASTKARVAMATCPANQQTKLVVDLLDVEMVWRKFQLMINSTLVFSNCQHGVIIAVEILVQFGSNLSI